MTDGQPADFTKPEGFSGGDVLIDSDSLIDPTITLQRIEELLESDDSRLPKIRVISAVKKDGPGQTYVFANQDGQPVAEATYAVNDEVLSDSLWKPTVHEGHTEQGYGIAMYLFFAKLSLENGHDFRTDPIHQTTSAVKMWNRLRDMGMAQVAQEFQADEGSPDLFRGYYVVNGNNLPKRSPFIADEILDLTERG